eukprot:3065867-Rhodomonas_salina.2
MIGRRCDVSLQRLRPSQQINLITKGDHVFSLLFSFLFSFGCTLTCDVRAEEMRGREARWCRSVDIDR